MQKLSESAGTVLRIEIASDRSDRKISAINRPTFCEIEYSIFNIFALVQFDFAIFLWNLKFRWNFVGISRQISENNENYRDVDEKCGKNAEISRKFRNCWKNSIRILNFSIVSLGIQPWNEDACLAAGCCRFDYMWGSCMPQDGFWLRCF